MIRKIFGLFIILTGIFLFLSNFDMVNFSTMMSYLWPLTVISIGIIGMKERKRFDIIFLIILLYGINDLLKTLDVIDKSIIGAVLWPLIFVLIGYHLLFEQHTSIKRKNNQKSYVTIFGGIKDKNEEQDFTQCEIFSTFGEARIDFSDIKLSGDKGYINVTSIFGGAKIILPDGYKVTFNGLPIFGGCDNKLTTNDKDADKEIIINYTVIFGGIEVLNKTS